MSRTISARGLSKRYQLGGRSPGDGTLRGAITEFVAAPLRRLRELRGESTTEEGEFWALKDVSFEIESGEVVGFVGRNGAGKSTLLKILSRIADPTAGRAEIRGRVASLLEVGTGFHPELSGRQNIYLNGSILGMRKHEIDRKFDQIVAFSEVERFLDTPVKRYSSGMYVRLAFAVAAHLEPEVLIVDEVLAVGDAEFQKRCLGRMKEVSQSGDRTVLFVSHNMTAVQSLCSRAILLSKGQIESQGSPADVVQTYLAAAVATGDSRAVFKRPSGASTWMLGASILVDGEPSATASMGSELSLAVTFESATALRHPKIGFILQTATGERLFNSSNRFQPSDAFDSGVTRGTITCELGTPPLMPGRYAVSLWYGDSNGDQHTEPEALTFEIVERDLWGLGRIPERVTPMWWPTRYSFAAEA